MSEPKTNYVSLSIDQLPESRVPYLVAFAQGLDFPFTLHVSESLDVEENSHITNNFNGGMSVDEKSDLTFDGEFIGTVLKTDTGFALGTLTPEFEEYVRLNKIQAKVTLQGEPREDLHETKVRPLP